MSLLKSHHIDAVTNFCLQSVLSDNTAMHNDLIILLAIDIIDLDYYTEIINANRFEIWYRYSGKRTYIVYAFRSKLALQSAIVTEQ